MTMKAPLHWWALSCAAIAAIAVAGACGSGKGSSGFGVGSTSGGASGGGVGADDGGAEGGDGFMIPGGDSGPFGTLGQGGKDGAAGDAGTIPVTVTSIDTCTTGAPSGLSAASVKALLAGGSAGSMRYLYPYASTIFPRGLIAPTLMWDGASADYVYVHIKSMLFEYKGCLVPTATGQVALPQDVWNAASAHTAGAADPFSLSLTAISSGTVTGPVTEPMIIAGATLKGSLYYNSYTTKLLANNAMSGGAVLRIVPGQTAQVFLGQSGCTGCHAVSANGSRMVADPYNPLNNGNGATYALTPTVSVNPTPLVASAPNGTFTGVYPDGTLYVGNCHPNGGFGGPRPGGPLATGPQDAGLFETNTGNAVSGSGIPDGVMMPTFSPDGKTLVFTDSAIASGGGMATMSFDLPSRKASAYKKIYQVSGTTTYPGWPFFLPDNGAVVFAIGTAADYSGSGVGLGVMGAVGLTGAPTSDLYILDSASGNTVILAQAMGYATAADASSNTTYLPFGASDELHHNYYPTVSPVAAGGYFWVFFDSYRHYGNFGLVRQLWGTAVDVRSDGKTYQIDPSHPPFFVTGQEIGTGNHRAFTALDPCHADGTTCTTGVDCCGGYCTNGMCGLPVPRCSNIDETCGPGHACCDTTAMCINGFCENPPPQ
jgi:hypothetical protein